jgi:hypothetical protein
LVVKKGSNAFAFSSSVMPAPVSVTASLTNRPGRAVGLVRQISSLTTTSVVSMTSRPPPGIASRAFTDRLTMICSSWLASA